MEPSSRTVAFYDVLKKEELEDDVIYDLPCN